MSYWEHVYTDDNKFIIHVLELCLLFTHRQAFMLIDEFKRLLAYLKQKLQMSLGYVQLSVICLLSSVIYFTHF